MKRNYRRTALLISVMLLAVFMLSACGSTGTGESDAQSYVKAVLDMMCLGDYDHSVKLADIEEGKETEARDAMIEDALDSIEDDISDEIRQEFKEVLIDAFSKTRYTVGKAEKTDDGGYDVTVTIEPLKIFAGLGDEMEEEEREAFPETDDDSAYTPEELNNRLYGLMVKQMKEGLKDPVYNPPQEVVVHCAPSEDGDELFSISDEDAAAMGDLLLSTEID